MSPNLKRLSGHEVVAALLRCGFSEVSSRGSHVKLRRVTAAGEKQTLTVPLQHSLDLGTLPAIVRQASRYLSEDEILREFYTR